MCGEYDWRTRLEHDEREDGLQLFESCIVILYMHAYCCCAQRQTSHFCYAQQRRLSPFVLAISLAFQFVLVHAPCHLQHILLLLHMR